MIESMSGLADILFEASTLIDAQTGSHWRTLEQSITAVGSHSVTKEWSPPYDLFLQGMLLRNVIATSASKRLVTGEGD